VDGECFGQTSRGPSREEDGKDGQFPAGKCGVEVKEGKKKCGICSRGGWELSMLWSLGSIHFDNRWKRECQQQ